MRNLMQILNQRANKSTLEKYGIIVQKINMIDFSNLTDREICEKYIKMKEPAQSGENLDNLLVEVYALVKEVVKRVLNIKVYDEQLVAATALHEGRLAEMQTGEGKTLAAVFPACLNALTEQGVHILTFNDYLAKRDAVWMGPIYDFLGLTVGYIQQNMKKENRIKAYRCDITYVTAKEAGFDYLRDFMCYEKGDLIHRPFNFAIADEADSILIDEAKVPLVIAASKEISDDNLLTALSAVKSLKESEHYQVDEFSRNVYLTEGGISYIENMLQCSNLYDRENFKLLNELNSALHAEVLLQNEVDYIVRNGKIEMIDEFTGRVAENRHWPDALQAALETKEGVKIQSKGRIMSQITLQGFLLLYKKIAGMTGTAVDSSLEILDFYELDIVVIPPHRPCRRIDYPDEVFTHKEAKFKALVKEIVKVHSTGQPILIGTSSVKESNYLASELKNSGVECKVLNAKNDELEAAIIEEAGIWGAVTVSTNMAGRGTDIKLGGKNEKDSDRIREIGGLYVIGTNRHESRRIDKQLRGRAGRQGDPGCTRFFISLEDDLLQKYGIDKIFPIEQRPVNQKEPITTSKIQKKIEQVQRIIEGQNSDIRRELWKYSIILENQRLQIHERRMEILLDKAPLEILIKADPELYERFNHELGIESFDIIQKKISLFHIDEAWADYLLKVAIVREGTHLNIIGGKNPLEVFRIDIFNAFKELEAEITERVLEEFRSLKISKDIIAIVDERLKPPTATWTYLVNDNTFTETLGMLLFGGGSKGASFAVTAAIAALPVLLAGAVTKYLKTKKKK